MRVKARARAHEIRDVGLSPNSGVEADICMRSEKGQDRKPYLCYPSQRQCKGYKTKWVFGRSSRIRRWKTAYPTCYPNFALIWASAFHLLTPNELRQRRLLLLINLHTRC